MSYRAISLAIICTLLTGMAVAQEEDRVDSAKARAARLASMKGSLEDIELTITLNGANEKLTRVEEPIQRWNNPVVQISDATVFVWTLGGLPTVIAQVAELFDGDLWQEFQSLSPESLDGRYGNESFWAPTSDGIRWMSASIAGLPAETTEARLIQMRRVVQRLQASDLFEFKKPSRLRLLSTPLYRYSAPKAGVLDGAIFSFALGTDPEVMVIVEAHKDRDAHKWMMAFARMTGFACTVTLDEKEIWSCHAMPWPHPRASTFMAHHLPP
ncbi:MAG: hypothetical protein O3C40_26760 [Planctomycetota bacterium]|nr:hypothetical protein [Planctomycetota bacterium]